MKNKYMIPFIIIELIIAGTMIYEKNYWAASGWGLYALSNIAELNFDKADEDDEDDAKDYWGEEFAD